MKNKNILIFLVSLLAAMVFLPPTSYGASVRLHPTLDGSNDGFDWDLGSAPCYNSRCYRAVDETSGSFCEGTSDGDGSFIRSNSSGANQTFELDEGSIPDGSTITDVNISACYRGESFGSARFRTRLCVDGSCSNANRNIDVKGDEYSMTTQSFSVNIKKSRFTDLEIGASVVSVDFFNNLRLSGLLADIEYKLPECNDGRDNDGDGLIDFPEDPHCPSASHDTEIDLIETEGDNRRMVVFDGEAYPNSRVFFMVKENSEDPFQPLSSDPIVVGDTGEFTHALPVDDGSPIFGVIFEDLDGRTTDVVTVKSRRISDQRLLVENISLPPTVELESGMVSASQGLRAFGYGFPDSTIEINIDNLFTKTTKTDSSGYWEYVVDTSNMLIGDHSLSVRHINDREGRFSSDFEFEVTSLVATRADLNNDRKVDIFDLSIFLSRWSQGGVTVESIDLNDDGRINARDLSIFLSAMSA